MDAKLEKLDFGGLKMSAQRELEEDFVSEAKYFDLLEKSETKLEWVSGEIRAMAGASSDHARISTRFATAINTRLPAHSTCEAVTSDVKTRVESADANYFPDVVLYCDDATFDPNRPNWLLTPMVIIEVLSPSTAGIDRTEKLDAYRAIPALRHYLLVDQKRVRIEHYRRTNDGWHYEVYLWRREDIPFEDLDISVPVAEIYRRMELPEGFILMGAETEA